MSHYTLTNSASADANFFMRQAIASIDDVYGEGEGKRRPALVAAFMQTCAIGLIPAVMDQQNQSVVLEHGMKQLTSSLLSIAEAIHETVLKPGGASCPT